MLCCSNYFKWAWHFRLISCRRMSNYFLKVSIKFILWFKMFCKVYRKLNIHIWRHRQNIIPPSSGNKKRNACFITATTNPSNMKSTAKAPLSLLNESITHQVNGFFISFLFLVLEKLLNVLYGLMTHCSSINYFLSNGLKNINSFLIAVVTLFAVISL